MKAETIDKNNPPHRPLKYREPKELEDACNAYFADCDKREVPYTIIGLANWLDIDRKTLINYQERRDFFHIITRAKAKCHQDLQEGGVKGTYNPKVTTFVMNVDYNLVEKKEIAGSFDVMLGGAIRKAAEIDDDDDSGAEPPIGGDVPQDEKESG